MNKISLKKFFVVFICFFSIGLLSFAYFLFPFKPIVADALERPVVSQEIYNEGEFIYYTQSSGSSSLDGSSLVPHVSLMNNWNGSYYHVQLPYTRFVLLRFNNYLADPPFEKNVDYKFNSDYHYPVNFKNYTNDGTISFSFTITFSDYTYYTYSGTINKNVIIENNGRWNLTFSNYINKTFNRDFYPVHILVEFEWKSYTSSNLGGWVDVYPPIYDSYYEDLADAPVFPDGSGSADGYVDSHNALDKYITDNFDVFQNIFDNGMGYVLNTSSWRNSIAAIGSIFERFGGSTFGILIYISLFCGLVLYLFSGFIFSASRKKGG